MAPLSRPNKLLDKTLCRTPFTRLSLSWEMTVFARELFIKAIVLPFDTGATYASGAFALDTLVALHQSITSYKTDLSCQLSFVSLMPRGDLVTCLTGSIDINLVQASVLRKSLVSIRITQIQYMTKSFL